MATTIVWRYSLDPYWEKSLEKMQQTKIIPLNTTSSRLWTRLRRDWNNLFLINCHSFWREKKFWFDKKYICIQKSIIHSSGFCDLSKMMINAFNWTADKVSILWTNDWWVTKVTSLAPTSLKSKDQLGQAHHITKIYWLDAPKLMSKVLTKSCRNVEIHMSKKHHIRYSLYAEVGYCWMNLYYILIG